MEDFTYLINFFLSPNTLSYMTDTTEYQATSFVNSSYQFFQPLPRPYSSAFPLKQPCERCFQLSALTLFPAVNGRSKAFRKGIVPFHCLRATDYK